VERRKGKGGYELEKGKRSDREWRGGKEALIREGKVKEV
jgi:hypothetical protein